MVRFICCDCHKLFHPKDIILSLDGTYSYGICEPCLEKSLNDTGIFGDVRFEVVK